MIIEFKHNGKKYKGQLLEKQLTFFNEEICKLKLITPDDQNLLGLDKNKLLLVKNDVFLKAYTEKTVLNENNKKETKKQTKMNKSKNLSLF